MSDRNTITIDGQVAYFIQYDEIEGFTHIDGVCQRCAYGPVLYKSGAPRCPHIHDAACADGLFLYEAEFAAARLGVLPEIKFNWDDES